MSLESRRKTSLTPGNDHMKSWVEQVFPKLIFFEILLSDLRLIVDDVHVQLNDE